MYIKELHVNHPNSYAVVHMSYGEITALANGMYELVSNLELLKDSFDSKAYKEVEQKISFVRDMVKGWDDQPYTIERASKTSLTKEEFERFNQYLIMNDYMMARVIRNFVRYIRKFQIIIEFRMIFVTRCQMKRKNRKGMKK